jgi:agmatinase
MSQGPIEMRQAHGNGTFGVARFVISDMVMLDQVDGEGAIISHKETGKRLKLSPSLYRVITKFRSPVTIEQAIGDSNAEFVRARIQQLIDLDFLMCVDSLPGKQLKQKLVRASVHTLFQAPRWSPGMPVPDVTVVGIPYDAGDAIAGARDAPDAIRQRSSHLPYSLDFVSQQPTGWFDVEARERYLEGVTLADWGNVWLRRGESPKTFFARVESACSMIRHAGSFPLFLGGDHSISFPVIKGLGDEKITVLWFDAHTDYGQLSDDIEPSHRNVLRAIASLPNVQRVCVLGHRGYTTADKAGVWPKTYPKLRIYTSQRLKSEMSTLVSEMVDSGTHCYVSVDINVLDPVYAPALASPIPGGLDPNQLKELFRSIGRRARIVGMDLTEINPAMDRGILTATQAMELLIVGVGAAMLNRTRPARSGNPRSRNSSAELDLKTDPSALSQT